jgi:hypothetical protein
MTVVLLREISLPQYTSYDGKFYCYTNHSENHRFIGIVVLLKEKKTEKTMKCYTEEFLTVVTNYIINANYNSLTGIN